MAQTAHERLLAEEQLRRCQRAEDQFALVAAIGALLSTVTGTIAIYTPSALIMGVLLKRYTRRAEHAVADPPRRDYDRVTRSRRSPLKPGRLLANDPFRETAVPAAETVRQATALLSATIRATERADGAKLARQRTQFQAQSYVALLYADDFRRVALRMPNDVEAFAASIESEEVVMIERPREPSVGKRQRPARLPDRLVPMAREVGVVAKRQEALRRVDEEPRVRADAASDLRAFAHAAAAYGESLMPSRLAHADPEF